MLLCSSSADGLVVLVGSPVGQRPHSSPIRDIKNKRIILVADVATALAGSTGSGAALRQFYCSRSGRQEICRAIPLQKNQFATPPHAYFYCVGVATCCFCYWVCILVLVMPLTKHSSCQFSQNPYFSIGCDLSRQAPHKIHA